MTDKLLKEPSAEYELELGKEKKLSLGKYQADSSVIFVTYEILGTTQIPPANTIGNLTDVFEVKGKQKDGLIYLNIDLTEVNPLFDGSTVSGHLNFVAGNKDKSSYSIGFKLFGEMPWQSSAAMPDAKALSPFVKNHTNGAAGEESDERPPAPSFAGVNIEERDKQLAEEAAMKK